MGEMTNQDKTKLAFGTAGQRAADQASMQTNGPGSTPEFSVKKGLRNVQVSFTELEVMNLARAVMANEASKTDAPVKPGKGQKLMQEKFDAIVASANPKAAMAAETTAALEEAAVRQALDKVPTKYKISTETQPNGNPPLTDRMGAAGTKFKAAVAKADANITALEAMLEKIPEQKAKLEANDAAIIEVGKVLMANPALAEEVKKADDAAKAGAAFDKIKEKLPPEAKAALAAADVARPSGMTGGKEAVASAQQIPAALGGVRQV